MSNATSRLQFVLSLIDRVSGPLSRIQARLHAMGLEQMALFRTNFHAYGNSAAAAARRVALITTALTLATAAGGALVASLAPLASIAGAGIGAAVGTANAMGVARESQQIQQQTGVSSVAVQLYRQAGRSQGLEAGFGTVGDVGQIFTDLNSKLAAPDDKLGETLNAVKLTLTDIKGLNADQVLQKVVNQAQKLGLNDMQASAVLDALAGDASKLLPLLKDNAAELNRLSHYADKVGAVITPKQAQLLAVANAEYAQMKTGVEGYGNILSIVGGNFMRLFGPEINQWFLDNADGMRQWADDSVKELQRLHGVFKRGGMRAVYEDLFPNLSAFTRRFGLFIDGFDTAFYTPFMAVVDKTWQRVSSVLGNAAGGAKGFGEAFGAALLPIFSATIQAIGDAVIFLEKNWNFVKQLFAWSPLGLIINNWGAIAGYLKPIGDAFKSVAESMGLVAPGLNDTGSAAGTVFGVLAALAGVLALNSLAFGAAYHVVKLYQGLMILLRASTMLVTVPTLAFNGAMAVLTSPILLVVAAIAALAAGAYLLYQNWDTVRPLLLAFWDSIVAKWEQFKTWVSDLITNLGTAFINGWDNIKTNTLQFVTDFAALFTALPSQFLTIGLHIMEGLFNGLQNAAGAVTNWVSGFVGGIVDDTKSLLGINSPSKIFAEIGGFTIEGMQVGMESAQSSLMDYLGGLGDKLKNWWSDLSSTFSGSDLADGVKSAFAAVQNAGLIAPAVAGVQSVANAVTGGTATSANATAATQSAVIPKSAAELGGLSAKYESNGNAGAIGFDKKGGWSYGKYQVATRTGTMDEFLKNLAKTNPAMAAKLNAAGGSAGAASGSGVFKSAWQDLAKNQAFSDAQHQFIQSTHYDPLVSRILSKTGIDINQRSKALQDVIWSTAVQHGGGTNVVEKALRATGKNASTVTDAELIKAIYNERAGRFGGSTASVRKSVQNRFVGEQAGALAMLNGGARALGGNVIPGHFYRVNERGPELLQTMGQTYLMTGGMTGNIIPFPTAELGGLSAKYESNGNAGAIGFDKKGGWSYGKYQVATRTGTMDEFLKNLAKTNPAMAAKLNAAGGSAGAASGSGVFKSAWQDLAKNQAFSDAQHQFIQSTHYDPLVSRILSKTGIDINQRSKALQDVIWSTAVQHGGGTNVVEKALRATGKNASTVTDAELIKAIYNERAGRFGGSTASVRKSVQNRFVGEQAGALAMLNGGARALGGNVIPGHFYRVNERGPELLQTMGQTYLMTGGIAGNIIPFPSAAERAQRKLSTTTSLLQRDVKRTALRDLTAQQSPQSRSSNSARANKTIHIGSVHIHTNNKIDPFELEQQLSMLG